MKGTTVFLALLAAAWFGASPCPAQTAGEGNSSGPAPEPAQRADGTQALWRQALGGRIIAPPSAQAESVSVVCDDGTLRSYGTKGKELWSYDAGGKLSPFLSRSREGTSYIGLRNGTLIAVNRSGRELWRRSLGSAIATDPLIGWDGRVFVLGGAAVFCLTASGQQLWSRPLGAEVLDGMIPDGSGGVLLRLADASLIWINPFSEVSRVALQSIPIGAAPIALDLAFPPDPSEGGHEGEHKEEPVPMETRAAVLAYADGKVEIRDTLGRSRTVDAPTAENPAALALRGDRLALADKDGRVRLFSITLGRMLWSGDGPSPGPSARIPPRLIMDERGTYILNGAGAAGFADDGRRLWLLRIQGLAATPVFGDEGTVYAGGSDWILYAYKAEERVRTTKGQLYGPAPEGSYGLGDPGPSPWADDPLGLAEQAIEQRLAAIERTIADRQIGNQERDSLAYLMEIAGSDRNPADTKSRTHPRVLSHHRVRATEILARIGSRETLYFLAELFSRDRESLVRASAALAIGSIGTDPEGFAMGAFAQVVFSPSTNKDERLMVAIAGAVGALCRFSGPPLSEIGIRLLVSLSSEDKPSVVRSKALAEIAELRGR